MDHRDSEFFVITNGNGAYNYQVLKASDEEIFDEQKWKVVVPHSSVVRIEDVDVFKVRFEGRRVKESEGRRCEDNKRAKRV